MPNKAEPANKRIVIMVAIATLSVFFVLLTAYTKYIYAKDYNFIVEAPCDPKQMTCYVRDCDEYCPPNELETYRAYLISASDYSSCTDNSCTNICQNESLAESCTDIICNPEDGNDCTT